MKPFRRRLLVASLVLMVAGGAFVAFRVTRPDPDHGFACAGVGFANSIPPNSTASSYSTSKEAVEAFVRLQGGDPADWKRRGGWYVRTGDVGPRRPYVSRLRAEKLNGRWTVAGGCV